jgi:hypothetical protein
MARGGRPSDVGWRGADEILAGYWLYVATRAHLFYGTDGASSRSLVWSAGDNTSTRARLAAQFAQAACLPAGSTIPQAGWPELGPAS